MDAATRDTPDGLDVPGPTEDGPLPPEVVERIRRGSAQLPFRLVAVVGLWFVYLLAVPVLWARYGPAAALLIPTAGTYLFSWLAFYRHELWHRYFPGIDNPTWFNVLSYLFFSDPQVYRLVHGTHHKYIHTPDDMEFFCEDWRTDRRRRRRQFLLELIFGNAAWELATFERLRREGRATVREACVALGKRLAIFASWLALVGWIEPRARWPFVATYALTVWLGAVMNRHVQWVEHLGILSEGSLAERNLLTRNLSSGTLPARLFNALSHHDAAEHVFHHTEPGLNSRGVGGLQLPRGARTITLSGYVRTLREHYRSL